MTSAIETHSYLYRDDTFSDDEQAVFDEITKLAFEAETEEERQQLVADVFKNATPEVMAKLSCALDYMSEYDEDMEKRAQATRTFDAVAGALLAVPVLGLLGRKAYQGVKGMGMLDRVYKEHPQLKHDPNIPRYYKLVRTFAPQVAANELLLGNVLKMMVDMGPAAVTPGSVQDLLSFETSGRQVRQEVSKALGELGKAYGGGKRKPGGPARGSVYGG